METKMTKEQKALLEPWANQYLRLYERLVGMSDEDLKEIVDACKAVSTTNCWCMTYAAAHVLQPEAEGILRSRAYQARKATAGQQS